MNTIYKYKKHINTMYKIQKFVSLPIDIFLLVMSFIFVIELLIIAIFLTAITILYIIWFGKLVSTEFELTDEGLIHRYNNFETLYKYEEITYVDSRSINYTGGWMLINVQGSKPIKILITLNELDTFILAFKAKLDELGYENKYDESKLLRFYKTSIYANQSWKRATGFMTKFFITVFIQMVVTVVISITKDTSLPIVFLAISMIVGMGLFLYYEFGKYVKDIREQVNLDTWDIPIPDSELEKKRMDLSFNIYLFFAVVGLTIGLLL